MKIIFIVSCLEPGRDGVGDYTRRLAAELIRQGQQCRIVSLNDKWRPKAETGNLKPESPISDLRSPAFDPTFNFQISAFQVLQKCEGTSVECLRLPGTLSWDERTRLAQEWVEPFNPDWISLQFVPFGFHPKGLCFGLGKKLKTIAPQAKWHIMFHELWLGLGKNSSLKHRFWGAMQRFIVLDMIKRLHPQMVHTQAEPYQKVLEENGVEASLLPLFSNVPLVEGNGWSDLLEPIIAKAIGEHSNRNEFYLAGVFGSVHPEWSVDDAVNALLPLTQRFQKRLTLVFLGKNNLSSEKLGEMKSRLQNRAVVVSTREKTDVEVSRILQALDLGLATSPYQLIQKSGSVAAMREYGLPVLVTRDDWRLSSGSVDLKVVSSLILTPTDFSRLSNLPTRDGKFAWKESVNNIASQMVKVFSP